MKFSYTISLFAAMLMVACGGKGRGGGTESGEYGDYAVVPLSSSISAVQPMTGIVFWADNTAQRNSEAISMEYSYMLYNEVVRERDVYDWSVVEHLLDEVSSRGHQAIIRFRYTYPGFASAVPDYIKQEPDYEVLWDKSEGRDTEFPDWRCAELRRFHLDFYRRFAERYDSDPRLAFLQTGFGLWAEGHIYDGPFIPGQTFPSKEFQTEFFGVMDESFDDLSWSVSIDAAEEVYSPIPDDKSLLELRFGLFDDSFMHESHSAYNTACWNFLGRDRYMTSPAGGEFSYYTEYDQRHVLDPEGMYGRTFENQACEFHISYMLGNDQPRYQTTERIAAASHATGYRFAVTDFRTKSGRWAVKIKNTGVAPIYRDAYVAVNGVRSEESLRTLLPGQERWAEVVSDSPNGVVTIECGHLVPGRKIEFEADVK